VRGSPVPKTRPSGSEASDTCFTEFWSQIGNSRQASEDARNFLILWWPLEDSNLQPKDYEDDGLNVR